MQKVIFLVDMNAFFISCEISRNSALKGKPAAVAGDPQKRTGIILAANYEARAFGVKTAMPLHEAMRFCPGLVTVPPDHDFYELKSAEVMALLAQFTPVLEQNSIDEAWLDMTGSQALFGTPVESAQKIMHDIDSQLDLWCSIGIAGNKFLAKMAAEMKKPQGITELWPEDVPGKLWQLPAAAMYGVGQKTAARLAGMGLKTIGDLARVDEDFLVSLLGKSGIDIALHARGIDYDPVLPRSEDLVKSIGRSVTLAEDTCDLKKAKRVLMALADEVGRSARKHGRKGHTLQITLKYADFRVVTRQVSIPATFATQDICSAGCRLLEQHWNDRLPVRLLGISLFGFSEDGLPRQVSLFDERAGPNQDDRKGRLDQAMDKIRDKHGENSIKRAPLIKKDP